MPYEQINFTKPEIDEGGGRFQHGELQVHWGKDQFLPAAAIQISMDIDGEYLRARALNDPESEKYGFLTDGLTVPEINKLIKTLIRAREYQSARQAWKQRWISDPEAGVPEWNEV